MTCGGCSGAVTRALKKAQDNVTESGSSKYHTLLSLKVAYFESVASYDVNLEKQEVIVKGTLPYDNVLAVIQKTGKEVCIFGTPYKLLLISSL
jgi:copper chaperone